MSSAFSLSDTAWSVEFHTFIHFEKVGDRAFSSLEIQTSAEGCILSAEKALRLVRSRATCRAPLQARGCFKLPSFEKFLFQSAGFGNSFFFASVRLCLPVFRVVAETWPLAFAEILKRRKNEPKKTKQTKQQQTNRIPHAVPRWPR